MFMNSRWTTHWKILRPLSSDDICESELTQGCLCRDGGTTAAAQLLQSGLNRSITGIWLWNQEADGRG